MGLLSSRPIGDELGRYRFVIDLDGHVRDERVADALLGLRRFSPRVTFLGSYPRADGFRPEVSARYSDEASSSRRATGSAPSSPASPTRPDAQPDCWRHDPRRTQRRRFLAAG